LILKEEPGMFSTEFPEGSGLLAGCMFILFVSDLEYTFILTHILKQVVLKLAPFLEERFLFG